MQFQNVYWDPTLMQTDGRQPSILAIGDSWFWYPFPGGSLLNYLGEMVDAREHVILAYGYNGAEAYDYVHGKYKKLISTALDLYGDRLSAVFISGGGNDFAGLNDLRPLLLSACANCTSASACFRAGPDTGTLEWLMDKVRKSYIALIDQILGASQSRSGSGGTSILIHTYDYSHPDGKGLFGPNSSPWLHPALLAANVPVGLYDPCIKLLLDRFADMLTTLIARYPGRVHLVDSRNTLSQADWANELHPTPTGFGKIAKQWVPILKDLRLA